MTFLQKNKHKTKNSRKTSLPELVCHHTVPTAVRRTTHTTFNIVGQAKIMSHLMSDGGGEAYRIILVILGEKRSNGALNSAGCIMKHQPAPFICRCKRTSVLIHTWFTPPEFSVHMANLFANPTVSPTKSFPLLSEESITSGQTGSITVFNTCADIKDWSSRHKLGVVMLRPLQKIDLPPHEEIVQSSLWINVNVDVVSVCPDLQTHQHDVNVQMSIQLQAEEETAFSEWMRWERRRHDSRRTASKTLAWIYLVDVIHNSENTRFSLASV